MKKPLFIDTPTYSNPVLNRKVGKQISLKMECYQPTGSFKARGIGTLCQHKVNEGYTHLVSSSGGNAGYSAAYAGRMLGVKVTVVVPENSQELARERIRAEGAELIVHGAVWDDANQKALEIVEQTGASYIHPFDNPLIWSGHATMMTECAEQINKPDVVLVAVGGGGLFCGVVEGLHDVGWQDVPVMTFETQGADSFAQSIAQGEAVTLDGITSIANTLGAKRVTDQALEWAKTHTIIPAVVSDQDAVNACLEFAEDMRVIVEPACGAALTALYNRRELLADYEHILVIVCGGAGITMQGLEQFAQQLRQS